MHYLPHLPGPHTERLCAGATVTMLGFLSHRPDWLPGQFHTSTLQNFGAHIPTTHPALGLSGGLKEVASSGSAMALKPHASVGPQAECTALFPAGFSDSYWAGTKRWGHGDKCYWKCIISQGTAEWWSVWLCSPQKIEGSPGSLNLNLQQRHLR